MRAVCTRGLARRSVTAPCNGHNGAIAARIDRHLLPCDAPINRSPLTGESRHALSDSTFLCGGENFDRVIAPNPGNISKMRKIAKFSGVNCATLTTSDVSAWQVRKNKSLQDDTMHGLRFAGFTAEFAVPEVHLTRLYFYF